MSSDILFGKAPAQKKTDTTIFVRCPGALEARVDVQPVIDHPFFNGQFSSFSLSADEPKEVEVVSFVPNVKQPFEGCAGTNIVGSSSDRKRFHTVKVRLAVNHLTVKWSKALRVKREQSTVPCLAVNHLTSQWSRTAKKDPRIPQALINQQTLALSPSLAVTRSPQARKTRRVRLAVIHLTVQWSKALIVKKIECPVPCLAVNHLTSQWSRTGKKDQEEGRCDQPTPSSRKHATVNDEWP